MGSSSKKSKSKENHSTPSVVVSNEPESENDRKEAYSSTIVTPTPVTIIEPTPKKNKLTNCLKRNENQLILHLLLMLLMILNFIVIIVVKINLLLVILLLWDYQMMIKHVVNHYLKVLY